METPSETPPVDSSTSKARQRLLRRLDKRWVVLGTVLFGVGTWGLPLLWKSRAFTRGGKVFWTIAFVLCDVVYWLGVLYVLRLIWQGLVYVWPWK